MGGFRTVSVDFGGCGVGDGVWGGGRRREEGTTHGEGAKCSGRDRKREGKGEGRLKKRGQSRHLCVRIVSVRLQMWVRNHDGLQMKATITNVDDNVRILGRYRRSCASQHLAFREGPSLRERYPGKVFFELGQNLAQDLRIRALHKKITSSTSRVPDRLS